MLATPGVRIDDTLHLVALVGIVPLRQDAMGQRHRCLKPGAPHVWGHWQGPQGLLHRVGPRHDRAQRRHAGDQAVRIGEVRRRLPHHLRLGFVGGHLLRGIRAHRVQQALSGLGDQAQGGRDGDVGEDMRGVFEPQPVADQAIRPRLRHDLVEERLMALHPQARATLGQHARHGQAARQGQVEKGPQGDIDLGGGHDFALREVIMNLQKRALDQPHRVFRRAPHRGAVAVGDEVPPPLNVDEALDPAQIVVRGHQGVKDPRVHLGRFGVIALFQHARPPYLMDGSMRYAGAPSGQLFKHPLFRGYGPKPGFPR